MPNGGENTQSTLLPLDRFTDAAAETADAAKPKMEKPVGELTV